jgi:hypothetical protein
MERERVTRETFYLLGGKTVNANNENSAEHLASRQTAPAERKQRSTVVSGPLLGDRSHRRRRSPSDPAK